jgi:lipopolysaccharide export system protein LptC
LRDALSTYLPLLLMALLALGTWWLVKNTPRTPSCPAQPAVRRDPDYTMTAFRIERFDPDGRLRVRVDGAQLRHFPTPTARDRRARIRAIGADGR